MDGPRIRTNHWSHRTSNRGLKAPIFIQVRRGMLQASILPLAELGSTIKAENQCLGSKRSQGTQVLPIPWLLQALYQPWIKLLLQMAPQASKGSLVKQRINNNTFKVKEQVMQLTSQSLLIKVWKPFWVDITWRAWLRAQGSDKRQKNNSTTRREQWASEVVPVPFRYHILHGSRLIPMRCRSMGDPCQLTSITS